MKLKLLMITLCISSFLNAQTIEFTSDELTTAEIGSTVKVDYKYTIAQDGYIYCAIQLLDDWTWVSEVATGVLEVAVAGTDVTGSFDLTIPESTAPTSDLTGNLNYKIRIELKQDADTWLAGAYPATQINLTASTASIDESFLSEVKVFPNPVKDVIHIKGAESLNNTAFSITNVLGKEVLRSNLSSKEISVSHLNSGIYILSIQSEKSSKHIKFIKE